MTRGVGSSGSVFFHLEFSTYLLVSAQQAALVQVVRPGRTTIGCVIGDADEGPCHLPGSGQMPDDHGVDRVSGLRNKKHSERVMKMWETQRTLPIPLRVQGQASGTKSGQGGAPLPHPHHFHPCISLCTCFLHFSHSIPAPNKGSPVTPNERTVSPCSPRESCDVCLPHLSSAAMWPD